MAYSALLSLRNPFLATPFRFQSPKIKHSSVSLAIRNESSKFDGKSNEEPSRFDGKSNKEIIDKMHKYVLMGSSKKRIPLVYGGGRGTRIYDVSGRVYLDFCFGSAIGHSPLPDDVPLSFPSIFIHRTSPRVRTASPAAEELAKRLLTKSFADQVIFVDTGYEANDVALGLARIFQPFPVPGDVIVFRDPSGGVVSEQGYSLPFTAELRPARFFDHGDTEEAVDLILSGKIVGVVVEPHLGEADTYNANKAFLKAIRRACDEADSLLIFNEVECGYGRMGHFWPHDEYGIYPDVLTVGEDLSRGLPFGALLMTDRVASRIEGTNLSKYNSIGFNAAAFIYEQVSNPDFLAAVKEKAEYFQSLLSQKIEDHPNVKSIEGRGMTKWVQLNVGAGSLIEECRNSGLLIGGDVDGDSIRLVPPLIASRDDLEKGVEILVECLSKLG